MNIRIASLHDAADLAYVHVHSWLTTYAGIISNTYLSKMTVADRQVRWERILNHPHKDEVTYVAVEHGRIIGFINGGIAREVEDGYDAEIYAIYLLEEAQRKRYGKQMVETLMNHFKSRDYASVMVWVLEENPSLQFYIKLGGQIIRKKEIKIGEEMLIEVAIGWKDINTMRSD
jgi:ribosomal protein S18 acetylase RimI-like enzyme